MAQELERNAGTGWSWFGFFLDAGIPPGIARKYSVVFQENRIRPDMLHDLDKETLQDMGVKAVGDILAIQKAAKDLVWSSLDPLKKSPLSSSSVFSRLGSKLGDRPAAAGVTPTPSPPPLFPTKRRVTKVPFGAASKLTLETVQQPVVSSSSSDKDKAKAAVKVKSTVTKVEVPTPATAPENPAAFIVKKLVSTPEEKRGNGSPAASEPKARTDGDAKKRDSRLTEEVKERKCSTDSSLSRSRSSSSRRIERSPSPEKDCSYSKHRSSSSTKRRSNYREKHLFTGYREGLRQSPSTPPRSSRISPEKDQFFDPCPKHRSSSSSRRRSNSREKHEFKGYQELGHSPKRGLGLRHSPPRRSLSPRPRSRRISHSPEKDQFFDAYPKHRSSSSSRKRRSNSRDKNESKRYRDLNYSPNRELCHSPPRRKSLSPPPRSGRISPFSDKEEKRGWLSEKREPSADSDINFRDRDEEHDRKRLKKEKLRRTSAEYSGRRHRESRSRTPSPFRKHTKCSSDRKRYSRSRSRSPSPHLSARRLSPELEMRRPSRSPIGKRSSGGEEREPPISRFSEKRRRSPPRTVPPPLLPEFSMPRPRPRNGRRNNSNPQDVLANLLSLACRERSPMPKYSNYNRLQKLVPLPLSMMRPSKMGPQQQKDKEYLLRKQRELERKYSGKREDEGSRRRSPD